MKIKVITLITIFIIAEISVILLVFAITNNNNYYLTNAYNGPKDLSYIKDCIDENEYYLFEDKGQKYILLKFIVSEYASKIEIDSINLINENYDTSNHLSLNFDIESKIEKNDDFVPAFAPTTVYKCTTIKLKNNISGLTVNGKEYNKFDGGIISQGHNKFGFIDGNGNITIELKYDSLQPLEQEVYNTETQNYDIADSYKNYLLACKNGKYGILDKNGNTLIECIYSYILQHTENTFMVNYFDEKTQKNKIGKIDINGNLLKGFIDGTLPISEGVTNYFTEQHSFILNNNKGIIDKDLNIVDVPR